MRGRRLTSTPWLGALTLAVWCACVSARAEGGLVLTCVAPDGRSSPDLRLHVRDLSELVATACSPYTVCGMLFGDFDGYAVALEGESQVTLAAASRRADQPWTGAGLASMSGEVVIDLHLAAMSLTLGASMPDASGTIAEFRSGLAIAGWSTSEVLVTPIGEEPEDEERP